MFITSTSTSFLSKSLSQTLMKAHNYISSNTTIARTRGHAQQHVIRSVEERRSPELQRKGGATMIQPTGPYSSVFVPWCYIRSNAAPLLSSHSLLLPAIIPLKLFLQDNLATVRQSNGFGDHPQRDQKTTKYILKGDIKTIAAERGSLNLDGMRAMRAGRGMYLFWNFHVVQLRK